MDAVRQARQPVYDMIRSFEARQQLQLDALLAPLNTLAERDDSIGRLVKRRLKRISADEPFLENVEEIGKLAGRLKEHDDAASIQSEIQTLENGVKQIESRTEALVELNEALHELLGPAPGGPRPVLPRKQYGQTRWDRAQVKLHQLLYVEDWDYGGEGMGKKVYVPRVDQFRGTEIEPLFGYVEAHAEDLLRPRLTFYWGFLTDKPLDIHLFGGIWPELVGTIYLTLGAILFAVPIGIIAAIYFTEYTKPGKIVSFLRTCVSTLAGVPSIVFGMFGLAFFLNFCHIPKGVLAGSLTLALLILPTIIRSAEEAIRAVPQTYREAALSLGAGRWHTIVTVILPAALPGILTGTVISMGRAAGETAPIIFTAAASVAAVLSLNPMAAWSDPTAALSWNIYNLCTEHEAVDEIRHVQFGMTAVLIGVVLLLNLTAIVMRARVSKKLKG
ncbi:phosphate ABC transporter permease PstA [Candidatus Sumerlaeota bacterium]|nr:phosphate ABC transporter permease PstA [Candidatus Sumerlaeota bacterium]